MGYRKLRFYDKEFKLNAIKLYKESGRSYNEISKELGIPITTLIGWVYSHKKDGKEAFPGKGSLKESELEMAPLPLS
jgi:transposase-like protein